MACSTDPDELVRVIDAQNGRAFRLAHRILGDSDEAADEVQDACTRAVRAMRSDTAKVRDADRYGEWFLRIVRNAAVDRYRGRAHQPIASLDEIGVVRFARDGDSPAEASERLERRADVLRTLLALTDAQRTALTFRECQGASYAEVGARLGLGEGATTMLLARARASFRRAYPRLLSGHVRVGCPRLAVELAALLDDDSPVDWTATERHVASCRQCQHDLRTLRRSEDDRRRSRHAIDRSGLTAAAVS